MKTVKFVLIAAFVTFALMSFSEDHKVKVNNIVSISLEKAMESRGLVRAMYLQLDQSFINAEKSGYYTAEVTFRGNRYLIRGSYKQWELFFLMDYILPIEYKTYIGHKNKKLY